MLRDWHRHDIFDALTERGWEGPLPFQVSSDERRYVGESYTFRRSGEQLQLHFVADFGDGYGGPRTIEAVVAVCFRPTELWLHRTRDSKWKRQLLFWASRVSGLAVPEIREPNLPPKV